LSLAVGAVAVATVAATPAWAVKTDVDGYFYDLPKGADANLDAVRALLAVSDGLGMTRRGGSCLANTNCIGTTTASQEYRASGTFEGQKADVVVIDFDYRVPAVRTDVMTADKKQFVTVAAKGLSWDEKTPGIFDKASTVPAADRLLQSYLLPPAVVYLGGLVADKIKLSTEAGDRILTIPLVDLSTSLKATIDANGYPVKTEIAYGGKVYTGEFSDFSNDRMDYHVFGPNRIVLKVDGKVTTDLDLEYHWTGPYMVFPTPKALAQK
jgi:hypothetical protein